MPTQVIMPQLGESVVEGTITRWLKAVGEPVEEFEPILEVNTDKVDTEVPSPVSGVLMEILVPEGTTVHAGETLATIGDAGEGGEAPQAQPAAAPPPEIKASPVVTPQDGGAIQPPAPASLPEKRPEVTVPGPGRDRELGFISPVVARIASEQGVDLYQVTGSGQAGRITKQDVLAYLEAHKNAPPVSKPEIERRQPPAPIPTPAPAPEAKAPPPPAVAAPTYTPMPGEVVPLNAVMEVDLAKVTQHRADNKDTFARDGVNLTFTAYFISACVVALKAYPLVNSSWSEEGILLHRSINVGMATSLGEEGLIVPVIKNADGLSLLGLARTINDLANRARARKLQPDEVRGGTFTITNHGTTGSLFATPIINQPQCAILGVGAIQKRVVVINDAIAIRPMAYLTLTFDHRILDGAVADTFLGKVVESLQNWG
jgi:pyruvate/2-oxoglutarate dehydrogenase complex dihydrolipoamide acyltransferase (E2) component